MSNNFDASTQLNKLTIISFLGTLFLLGILVAVYSYFSKEKATSPQHNPPISIPPSTMAVGGDHICWIDAQQKTWCWGNNDSGQLGQRHLDTYTQAYQVDQNLSHPFKQLSAYRNRTCAINTLDELYCWGGWFELDYNNEPITAEMIQEMKRYKIAYQPLKIELPQAVQQVGLGILHTCALLKNNQIWCWGHNKLGQQALTKDIDLAEEPHHIQGLPQDQTWQRIVAGPASNCAISTTGHAWCWGLNLSAHAIDSHHVGSLSRDPTRNHIGLENLESENVILRKPQPLTAYKKPISDIVFNLDTACVLTPQSKIKCWGGNTFNAITGYQKQDFLDTATNLKDSRLQTISTFSANSFNMSVMYPQHFFCGLTTKNQAYCWGVLAHMDYSGIGRGYFMDLPDIGQEWTGIGSGERFSCVQAKNHDVYCWGDGLEGGVFTETQVLPKDFKSDQVYQLTTKGLI